MSQLNRSLLQFVALALPAVAILLQVMLTFQDKYSSIGFEKAFRREFRLVELSLFFLVIAGSFFSFSLFNSASSTTTKIGIALLSLSLLLLGLGTWLMFGRVRYPTERFDTPEELLKSSVLVSAPLILLSAAVIIFRNSISNLIQIPAVGIVLTILFGNIGYVALKYYYWLQSKKEKRKKIKSWRNYIDNFKDSLEKQVNIANGRFPNVDEREFRNQMKNLQDELSILQSEAPAGLIREDVENALAEIERSLSYLPKANSKIVELENELEQKEDRADRISEDVEEYRSRIHEISERLDEIDEQLPERAFSDSKEPEISEFYRGTRFPVLTELRQERADLKSALQDREEKLERLFAEIDETESEIERISSQMTKAANTAKEALNTIQKDARVMIP